MSAPEPAPDGPSLPLAEFERRIGDEVGVSDWLVVDQAMVDAFANVSGDHQFIHVDPDRAAATPYGGTIAHGFLVLSLLSRLRAEAVPRIEGVAMGINYGFERVRFTAPVRTGAAIRGRFVLKELSPRSETADHVTYQLTWGATVDIRGEDKPALVADWLTRAVLVQRPG